MLLCLNSSGHIMAFHSGTPCGEGLCITQCCTSSSCWSASWAEILATSWVITVTTQPQWSLCETLSFLCEFCAWARDIPCIGLCWASPLQRNSRVHQLWTWCDLLYVQALQGPAHKCPLQVPDPQTQRALSSHQNRDWGLSGHHKGHLDICLYLKSQMCVSWGSKAGRIQGPVVQNC